MSARAKLATSAATLTVAAGAALLWTGLTESHEAKPAVLPQAEFSIAPTSMPPVPTDGARPLERNRDAALGREVPKPCQVPSRPMQVALPRLCLRGEVVPRPVGRDGLVIPDTTGQVALWTGGPRLGSDKGTTLLAGHVDSRTQGRGVFHDLYLVQPGDAVYTTDTEGDTQRWRVSRLQVVPREALPDYVWHGPRGPRTLVLVTCGGKVVNGAGAAVYEDNVIVTAVPG